MVLLLSQARGAVFDFDGTLADSLGVWKNVDRKFFENRGLPEPDGYEQAIQSMSITETAEYTRALAGLPESCEEIIKEWHELAREEYNENVRLKPGAADFVLRLRNQGLKLALATASCREFYEPVLKSAGIYGCFDAFTTLEEVSRNKSFPDIYEKTAEKLGLKTQECVAFEDILPAVCGAKSCGMKVIGVYDSHSERDSARIKQAADGYILSFKEI
ncbi:MAG TPA: HAD family phosphatase [Clostridia bacterium]|nr:HAD family phosphatase [Clostridia bacterium]